MNTASRRKSFMNNDGSVVLMVAFLSIIAMGFFIYLTSSIMRILAQTDNIRNATIASYVAESAIEESIVEYFMQSDDLAPSIHETRDICIPSNDPKESALEFFNCAGGDKIGEIMRTATRYKPSIEGYLDRYATTEFWFTDKENESEFTITDLKSLKIEWNISDAIAEQAGLTIILARWPKDHPRNIQTQHIPFLAKLGSQEYVLSDSLPKHGSASDHLNTNDYQYILFLKTTDLPTHFRIVGLGEDDAAQDIPSKFLDIQVATSIEDRRDPTKLVTKQFRVLKEIYTDYDSSFPYLSHLLD